MELLTWLEQTELSLWLRESDWGHPIVLCFHAVGIGLVVGISLMFSARVLGYSKNFPLDGFDKLFGLAWFGFGMNAVSGVLLYVGEPRRLLLTLSGAYLLMLIAPRLALFYVVFWVAIAGLQRLVAWSGERKAGTYVLAGARGTLSFTGVYRSQTATVTISFKGRVTY